jgi:hypothetical protein
VFPNWHRRLLTRKTTSPGRPSRGRRPLLEALEDRVLAATRLFALPKTTPAYIAELSPTTGAEVKRFLAPEPGTGGADGLAFDGQTLYFLSGSGDRKLWQLNPNTGAVLGSDVIATGSGQFDDLGVVNGQVYVQDYGAGKEIVFNPKTHSVTGTVAVTGLPAGTGVIGGLAGADTPDELIATFGAGAGQQAARIDPTTGAVSSTFGLGGNTYAGVAFVNGELYFGDINNPNIRVTDRAGNLLNNLAIPYPVSALGGDSSQTEHVVNGNFEASPPGSAPTGWTVFNEPGSGSPGWITYSGSNPQNSGLSAPPQGNNAVYNLPSGPGTYELYQDVTLPAGQTSTLSLKVYYHNADGNATPSTLDFTAGQNQQFRIDVVTTAANLLSTTTGVLLNVFQTTTSSPTSLTPTTVTADLTPFAGQTVRLRLAVADNAAPFFGAVDAVSVRSDASVSDVVPVANGGFETGTFSGWTTFDQSGGNGSWQVYSGTGPHGFAPPQGTFAAVTTQQSAGSHILYQDVAIPAGVAATLSMLVYYKNFATAFATPATLDYTTAPNQQYRIDLVKPTAPLQSVAQGDVLANVFQTHVGDPLTLAPTLVSFDLTPFAGQTVRLRFAEVDNQGFFNASVDAVSISSSATGTVSGTLFNDANGNGARDGGEAGLPNGTVYADLNNNGVLDPGEPSAVTDANGNYALTGLAPGTYTIREVPQGGWQATAPQRLFAVRGTSGNYTLTIYELNGSGTVLNSFPAPGTVPVKGPQGLAAGPGSLFYIDGVQGPSGPWPHTLYELNEDTGAVIRSDVLPSTSEIAGLGYLNGLVYVEIDDPANQLLVFNPATHSVVATLNVASKIFGGLAGAADLGLLFASNAAGDVVAIDPSNGVVVNRFNPGVGQLYGGLAYRAGELLAAPFGDPSTVYRLNPSTGAVLGSFPACGSGVLSALGGDGVSAYVVTVGAGQAVTGRDFGARAQLWQDFGDAPAPYPTLLSENGARHVVVPGFSLGPTVAA